MSLTIPGSGQVYNHDYWKIPVVYAGLGLFISTAVYNQNYYKKITAVAIIVRTGYVPQPGSSYYSLYKKYKAVYDQFSSLGEDRLADLANGFQRDRDLSILGIIGTWGINVIDAYVNAKFIRSYTMDNNFSFKVTPTLVNGDIYAANGSSPILALKIILFIN